MDLLSVYILNLVITSGMFVVLAIRAWIELKNYKMMWKELEWRQTYRTIGRVLKAERHLFTKIEGGEELYRLLCEVFKTDEERS